tara:strand:- start:1332 stop:2255 length:924 start_codon:yes stop_codon:yes gene_type:complete
MNNIINIKNLTKTYSTGEKALNNISLEIEEGEIFALLGPNGAGKTTLISTICGISMPSSGSVSINDYDVIKDYKKTRQFIGLVPQEIYLEIFETVINTVKFSRGLFGKPKNDEFINKVLKDLNLWDKRNSQIQTLSGGMKRRVLIAKALCHEPKILFLDEPSAGVDVELRKDMWNLIRNLRKQGVTVILTTHYIEEAEEIADRVGIINKGELILVEDKNELMKRMGQKEMSIHLFNSIKALPKSFERYKLILSNDGYKIEFSYDTKTGDNEIINIINDLKKSKIIVKDIETKQSSLEDIFVNLIRDN